MTRRKRNNTRISIQNSTQKKTVKTVVKPVEILLSRKKPIEAYRSSISNLFTENDVTLTTQGYVRLFTDTGYYGDVQKSLTIYQQDDLIGGLVDAFVNVANTRINFDLSSNNESESDIWETWARIVNSDTKSTLPGLTMLNEIIMKSMVLTGMAVPDFEWGELVVGKKILDFPMKINVFPSLGVKLQTSTLIFGEEDVLVGVSDTFYKSTIETANTDVAVQTLFTDYGEKGKAMIRKNAYPIKFKYTPNNQTLYPTPMLKRSFESIALRHKLLDSDLSILEMVINKITQIKVGDKDNPPIASQYDEDGKLERNGDIEEAQLLFSTLDSSSEIIATPYYYDIKVIMPDTTFVLDQKKYVQSTCNIYSNFGIMIDPSASSNSIQFEQMNLKNYEKNAMNIQNYVAGWYNWLVFQIYKRNLGKIKAIPTITFDRPDVYTDAYLNQLANLYTLGATDVYTLLEKYGLDPDKIKERKKIQKKDDVDTIWEARASFKQQTVNGNETKTSSTSNSGGINDKSKANPINAK